MSYDIYVYPQNSGPHLCDAKWHAFISWRCKKVVYRLPATSSWSPGIACRQCVMIGWHVACDWKRGGSLLLRWRRLFAVSSRVRVRLGLG